MTSSTQLSTEVITLIRDNGSIGTVTHTKETIQTGSTSNSYNDDGEEIVLTDIETENEHLLKTEISYTSKQLRGTEKSPNAYETEQRRITCIATDPNKNNVLLTKVKKTDIFTDSLEVEFSIDEVHYVGDIQGQLLTLELIVSRV